MKFQWDPIIIDWCNAILFLGGKRTFNFIRGPVNFQKGKSSYFNLSLYNLPLPDERTCRRHSPGYSTEPGIVRELLVYFLKLIRESLIPPALENNIVCLYAVSMGRDGIGLKPELSFDPVSKVLVGLTDPVDTEFIAKNPTPDEKEIKKGR